MISGFIGKIRRRETPFYRFLYRCAKRLRAVNMPPSKMIYTPLRLERAVRLAAWHRITRFLYFEPLFKTCCVRCGRGLQLYGGIPQLTGNLKLLVGENVTMHGKATFSGGKVHPEPTLTIGDNSYLGYQMDIAVGETVTIGKHVLIANRVALSGYDFHPLDPVKRSNNDPPDASGAGPIVIEDYAWICMDVRIMKGVTVGEGAVVGAASVVTCDVPPYTLAVGNPARVVRSLNAYRQID